MNVDAHIPFKQSPAFTLLYIASMSSSIGNVSAPIERIETTCAIRNLSTTRTLLEKVLSDKESIDMDLSTIVSSLYHQFVSGETLHDNPIFELLTGKDS